MFYSIKIIRNICLINKESINLNEDIKREIITLYNNRMIEDYGLFIEMKNDLIPLNILKKKVKNFQIFYTIEFNAYFYKLFEDEIIEGIVYYQNSKSILIQTPLLKNIICIPEKGLFFSNSGFDSDKNINNINYNNILNEETGSWYWIYDSYKLLIKNQDIVRCKVINMEFKPCRVLVSMDNVGLGPINWWL